MRVLTVSHFFESHGGGIERVAGHLCRQFAELGATPVWAASDGDALPECETELVPLPCSNPTEKLTGLPMPVPGTRALRELAREIRRSDAVVVHDALYLTSIFAMLIAKVRRKRVILIQHIAAIAFSSWALRMLIKTANILVTRPMLWAADERVFISDTVRRDLVGARPNSSELLFNGVDGAIFHPGANGNETPAAALNVHCRGDGPRVLFVGRYVEKKGLEVLRTLAMLRPTTTFILVGSGPIRPKEWGLANVHDLGPQTQHALADLYRWTDLLLLPSVGEGYPLVIQEAMACGLPVICGAPCNRADPDAARWLRGVTIDLADPQSSAARCLDAMESFTLSASECAEMAAYALRQYNWRAMAQRLMDLAVMRTPRSIGLSQQCGIYPGT